MSSSPDFDNQRELWWGWPALLCVRTSPATTARSGSGVDRGAKSSDPCCAPNTPHRKQAPEELRHSPKLQLQGGCFGPALQGFRHRSIPLDGPQTIRNRESDNTHPGKSGVTFVRNGFGYCLVRGLPRRGIGLLLVNQPSPIMRRNCFLLNRNGLGSICSVCISGVITVPHGVMSQSWLRFGRWFALPLRRLQAELLQSPQPPASARDRCQVSPQKRPILRFIAQQHNRSPSNWMSMVKTRCWTGVGRGIAVPAGSQPELALPADAEWKPDYPLNYTAHGHFQKEP